MTYIEKGRQEIVSKMIIPKFVTYTFAGSCVWSTGTILSGYYFGEAIGLGTSTITSLP